MPTQLYIYGYVCGGGVVAQFYILLAQIYITLAHFLNENIQNPFLSPVESRHNLT